MSLSYYYGIKVDVVVVEGHTVVVVDVVLIQELSAVTVPRPASRTASINPPIGFAEPLDCF
jgi:hypothetical protein